MSKFKDIRKEDIVRTTPNKRRNKLGFLLEVFRYNVRYKKFNKQLGIYQHKPIAKAWINFITAMDMKKLNRVKKYLKYKAINYKGE